MITENDITFVDSLLYTDRWYAWQIDSEGQQVRQIATVKSLGDAEDSYSVSFVVGETQDVVVRGRQAVCDALVERANSVS